MKKMKYICEVCGKTEITTPEEAFDEGWDYPPFMGTYGVVSPRTCPYCTVDRTVWGALVLNKVPSSELTDKQKETIERILGEPDNMIVEES